VRDNLETLYGAVDEGALPFALPRFVRKELEGYLDCGLLCRGFAHVTCEGCHERRLVAFACKGRGFCPSCLGRRMASTAANLVECVLPPSPLRQWVLTVPYAWRSRLAYDGALLGVVTRVFVRHGARVLRGADGEGGGGERPERCCGRRAAGELGFEAESSPARALSGRGVPGARRDDGVRGFRGARAKAWSVPAALLNISATVSRISLAITPFWASSTSSLATDCFQAAFAATVAAEES
jgi:hypothetical protein